MPGGLGAVQTPRDGVWRNEKGYAVIDPGKYDNLLEYGLVESAGTVSRIGRDDPLCKFLRCRARMARPDTPQSKCGFNLGLT